MADEEVRQDVPTTVAPERSRTDRRIRWRYVIGAIVMVPILGFACIGVAFTALMIAVLVAVDDVPWAEVAARRPLVEVGEPAPDFVLQNLDGLNVALDDYRGRPVLVNFWASWCLPCTVELEEMSRYRRREDEEPLTIVAVNIGERRDTITRAVEDLSPGILVLVNGSDAARAYGVDTLPTSVLVGPDGVVSWVSTKITREEDLVRLATGGRPAAYPGYP